ncbi:MAG: cereblon family protein [Desulfovibrionaceae bacterium]|nr:hypothetical protein [Desulfovibrionaceae bacterium]MDD4952506.1 cereblon family protein [Desulfovibrionaceae bacterium]
MTAIQHALPCPTPFLAKEAGQNAPGGGAEAEDQAKPDNGQNGPRLLCRACRFQVTWANAGIRVNGRHSHVFFNPYGLVFTVACFSTAPGCGLTGRPSSEFAWFPGYSWQIAVCGRCQSHLGWRFLSGNHGFWGLIPGTLVEDQGTGS